MRNELIGGKGIAENVVDKIGEYVQMSGTRDLIERLSTDELLQSQPQVAKGLEDLKLLLHYCEVLEMKPNVTIDLSLARGLDYYTGVIFEAVLQSESIDVIHNDFPY